MTLPETILCFRWLTWDTFRQARASGIYFLMLFVSALAVTFCLSVRIEGAKSLEHPGEHPEFLPPRDKLSQNPKTLGKRYGIDVVSGRVTLGFGAFELPVTRDAEEAVRFLQVVLARGVADAIGILLTLIWTAGFLPTFLEPAAASILFAKPVPRWFILAGKVTGVVAFVGFQAAVFIGGTWMALGLATGQWVQNYLLAIPLLLVHFAAMYSVSVLLAVCTRNTVAAAFGSLLFWFMCWGLGYGRHALTTLPYLEPEAPVPSSHARFLVEAMYWIFPKPADFGIILRRALHMGDHLASASAFEKIQDIGAFHPEVSLLTSLVFALVMLGVASRQLATTDY
jgi:hypothetical protein